MRFRSRTDSWKGILREPEAAVAVAVVCHPHPRGGGTMNNNVVYRVGKALVAGGVAALRFNFRGVGASTGSYADGIGEEDDARAALAFARTCYPTLPLWMAGFSFGARVGLTVGAASPDVERLLGVGLALRMFDYGFLARSDKRKAIVQAAEDEYGGRAEIEAAVQRHGGSEAAVGRRRCHAPVPRTPRPVRSRGVGSRRLPARALTANSRGGTGAACPTCRGRTAEARLSPATWSETPRAPFAPTDRRCSTVFDVASCHTLIS